MDAKTMILASQILGGLWMFALGATVGSFANVCVYRIPWQMSVIWPGSHCPRCRNAIRTLDNIPVVGWLVLRGRCRNCRLPIAARYPLIETLSGLLFVVVYYMEIVVSGRDLYLVQDIFRLGYHLLLVTFLIVATFIDYDYQILPDEVTLPGIAVGLFLGFLAPEIRKDPGTMSTGWDGLLVGFKGAFMGGIMIWAIRIFGRIVFRREAMGFGDVTLMAMIGAFLGWQILPPTLFLAAFLGLIHALFKALRIVGCFLGGRTPSNADREIPFGPYLSMAAVLLMLNWSWLWPNRLSEYYNQISIAARFLIGGEL